MSVAPEGWLDPAARAERFMSDRPVLAVVEQTPVASTLEPLCPFCVASAALPFPRNAPARLCNDHLAVERALQCRGWNADPWHQHLAALARWGKLPSSGVEWWLHRLAQREGTRSNQEARNDGR